MTEPVVTHSEDDQGGPKTVTYTGICGRCKAGWTGYSAAHCGSCHATFTSVSGFDRHRKDGQCQDPESVGLVPRERLGWTGWGFRPDPNRPWHSDSRVNGSE